MEKGTQDKFIARAVLSETWEKLRDKPASDEDIEIEKMKQNPLMRDYIFCDSCEKIFFLIESLYANIFLGKSNKYDAAIPYLFWMSVVWRMSVERIGITMRDKDEEKLRKVLDKTLAEKRECLIMDVSKLGRFAYCISKTDDMKGENVGIMGFHTPTIPYAALIGNLEVRFFMSRHQAHKMQKKLKKDGSFINEGKVPERIDTISFLEFWTMKQIMLKENRKFAREFRYNPFSSSDLWKTNNLSVPDIPFFDLENSYENPNVFNEYDYCLPIPRSIEKILTMLKKNENHSFVLWEEIAKETGCTKEEVTYMLEFWHETTKEEIG